MGTNYYLRPPGACPVRCDRWVHLGKSSAGWTFTFRAYPVAYPEVGITGPVMDFPHWLEMVKRGGTISDEYGTEVTLQDLLAVIGRHRDLFGEPQPHEFLDALGHRFMPEEFH